MKYSTPKVSVTPPGPKAREVILRDERVVSPSNWRYLPLVLKDGEGAFLEDVDGNVFLDFNAAAATQNLGVDHPRVIERIRGWLDNFVTYLDIPGLFYHEVVVELCEKIATITPGKYEKRVFLGLSGADAAETAMKLARWYTRRPRFIAFTGSNYGVTGIGALSLFGFNIGVLRGFSPLMPGVTHVPYPYPYRWPFGEDSSDCGMQVLEYLEKHIFRTVAPPDEVAAIFVEPILGDGGVVVPPDGFLEGLQAICLKHGILLVVDEVQTGFGRTGSMFASDHWKLEPDILMLGKPMGGGLPVSACVARSEIMSWPRGSHVMTGAGYLLGCVSALEAIKVMEEEKLAENAQRVGGFMLKRLKAMRDAYDIVGDVRGKGLLIGVEIVRSKRSKEPGVNEVAKACLLAFRKGLLTAYDGIHGNVFRLTPPLILTEQQARTGMDILEEALATVQREGAGEVESVW